MSVQTNIAAAHLRIVTAINTLNTRIGTLTNLNTLDKSSVVAALNELKASVAGVGVVNDAVTNTTNVWSSNKVQTQINVAITAILNGADGANDTLQELANRINALAAADTGLLSFNAAQTLTAPQQVQGCANLGIGDPAHDYVPAIVTGLAAGL